MSDLDLDSRSQECEIFKRDNLSWMISFKTTTTTLKLLHSDVYRPIFFNFGMLTDTTAPYILIYLNDLNVHPRSQLYAKASPELIGEWVNLDEIQ